MFLNTKRVFLTFFTLLHSVLLFAQVDYSNSWEDLYAYTNVKDFIKTSNAIYCITDNAVFIYNISTKETKKISSINGLSGETTTAIHYDETREKLVLGYENGLIEVVDKDGNITISADIVNFNQSGRKSINHIAAFNNLLYLATPFAIVVYDIDKLEFGDTYFIGNGSSSLEVHQTLIHNGTIYAAAENGIYTADRNHNALIDFRNWTKQFNANFTNITLFNNRLFTSVGTGLYEIRGTALPLIRDFSSVVKSIKGSATHLTVGLQNSVHIFDRTDSAIIVNTASNPFAYNLNTAYAENGQLYVGTREFGLLNSALATHQNFEEIHPEGPLSNSAFSITTNNNNLWVVYGGYDDAYVPLGLRSGFSHFNGTKWINTQPNPGFPIQDLVQVTIDPNHDNRVFISSFSQISAPNAKSSVAMGGLLVVEDDMIKTFYKSDNSGLEDSSPTIPNYATVRVSGSVFDNSGNLWVTNSLVSNNLKKMSSGSAWSSVDLSVLETNTGARELNKIIIDRSNTLWIGTRRNGVYAYRENGDQKRALTTEATRGNLPHANVRAVAADNNNRIWLGTQSGLVVYNNAGGIFEATTYDAAPIIILDDGIPKRLLGDQTINAIVVDGADNKWFGTDNGGVLYTNPNGQRTLASFNKSNSPLPSNRILEISVDNANGKVYFVTDKGIVAYKSNVAPFGEELADVYAYPNPALKQHATVTIDGKNGKHLPKGTNVKILDVSGNLVYETNVVEGQELQGGKVVWNKTNLAGRKVASGIYIVLLANEDNTETTTTKIAIVN